MTIRKTMTALILILPLLILSACGPPGYRLQDEDNQHYIDEYGLTHVYLVDCVKLNVLDDILDFNDSGEDYDAPRESVRIIYGRKDDGKDYLLFIPYHRDYDIHLMESPLHPFNEIIDAMHHAFELDTSQTGKTFHFHDDLSRNILELDRQLITTPRQVAPEAIPYDDVFGFEGELFTNLVFSIGHYEDEDDNTWPALLTRRLSGDYAIIGVSPPAVHGVFTTEMTFDVTS